ncbi:hypothetical protein HMI54_000634 [Coelomomyces lativittatus]|nr:hypothetical protein HMI54_000634 [Coelomomyces lativittatus]
MLRHDRVIDPLSSRDSPSRSRTRCSRRSLRPSVIHTHTSGVTWRSSTHQCRVGIGLGPWLETPMVRGPFVHPS